MASKESSNAPYGGWPQWLLSFLYPDREVSASAADGSSVNGGLDPEDQRVADEFRVAAEALGSAVEKYIAQLSSGPDGHSETRRRFQMFCRGGDVRDMLSGVLGGNDKRKLAIFGVAELAGCQDAIAAAEGASAYSGCEAELARDGRWVEVKERLSTVSELMAADFKWVRPDPVPVPVSEGRPFRTWKFKQRKESKETTSSEAEPVGAVEEERDWGDWRLGDVPEDDEDGMWRMRMLSPFAIGVMIGKWLSPSNAKS